MRKALLTMATAAVATIGLAAAPAHATASDVNMSFGMSYGASTTSGTIHFTDGYSATVSGAVHAAERRPPRLRLRRERLRL
ncbi:Secreted protein OS=Streptomyces fumanus OX=67302 GN=GCM10018772_35000 PE=4 SV=1 [Streptomyces fumanus]